MTTTDRIYDEQLLNELGDEIERQDLIHPAGYPATRDGVRFGIATVEDETKEALDAWRAERKVDGWPETRGELLQVAAVTMRIIRSIDEADAAFACQRFGGDLGGSMATTEGDAA
jgi:hypothetical protein